MLSILPYFLANVSLVFLEAFLRSFIYSRTVPVRWSKTFLWGLTGVTVFFWVLNNYACQNGTAVLDIVIIFLFMFGAPCLTEKGFRLKGLLTSVIFIAIEVAMMNCVALAAFPIAGKLGYSPECLVDRTTSFGNAIMVLICFPAIIIPTWTASRILRKNFTNRHFSIWCLCFLPIPVSQGVILNLVNRLRPYAEGVLGLDASFMVAFLISVAADIAFFYGINRIQKAERLRDQIRTAEEQLAIQNGYYLQLQENILTINQIRHDLSNQLQAAYALLEQGQEAKVRSHLDQIQADVRDRVGPKFCPNLMVDAILSEKARICQKYGIRLDINAQLPQELSIESTHLCSAFSNLLDNSIQAVRKITACEKYIELCATLHADYLIIRCTNPADVPDARGSNKNPLRHHGLGLAILNRIAQEYHGSLDTEYRNRLFEAILILRFTQ